MRNIMSLNEMKTAHLLPKEIRLKNPLYHSTDLESFLEIIKDDKIYGTHMYDIGVATSRNKHYGFGRDVEGDYDVGNNLGDVQFILDRDKVRTKYKVEPFDWEEFKLTKATTKKYARYHQSEDKIMTDIIKDLHKYLIGVHIVNNKVMNELFADEDFVEYMNKYDLLLFNEDWEDITNKLKGEEKGN